MEMNRTRIVFFVIIGLALLIVAAGVVYGLVVTPLYQATAQVRPRHQAHLVSFPFVAVPAAAEDGNEPAFCTGPQSFQCFQQGVRRVRIVHHQCERPGVLHQFESARDDLQPFYPFNHRIEVDVQRQGGGGSSQNIVNVVLSNERRMNGPSSCGRYQCSSDARLVGEN